MGLTELKSRCQQAALLPEALGENPSPRLFQLLEATKILVSWLPSAIFKVTNI